MLENCVVLLLPKKLSLDHNDVDNEEEEEGQRVMVLHASTNASTRVHTRTHTHTHTRTRTHTVVVSTSLPGLDKLLMKSRKEASGEGSLAMGVEWRKGRIKEIWCCILMKNRSGSKIKYIS